MINNNKKRMRVVVAIIVLGLLVFIFSKGVLTIQKMQDEIRGKTQISYSIPSEDSSLFAEKYRKELKANAIYLNRDRAPVSVISYGNNNLIIHRIDLQTDISLRNLLHTENKSADIPTGETYFTIQYGNLIKFQYLDTPAKPVSKIYMTLLGDSLQSIVENDSIVNYYLLCKNFSMKYVEKDPIDLFMEGREKAFGATASIPTDILLYKKAKKLYLLIMTPNSAKSSVSPDALFTIINHREESYDVSRKKQINDKALSN